jgi:hypothetical protein
MGRPAKQGGLFFVLDRILIASLVRQPPSNQNSRILLLRRLVMPIRWRSSATFLEYPLVSVSIGPDLSNNESRGHARGIIALGDVASGFIALGGIARGVVALGGLAVGGIAIGGGGIGILSFAGVAIGGLAVGGLAVGYAAIGGLAIGYYAMGGGAIGKFLISALRRDPQAVDFFSRLLRGILVVPKP